MAWNPNLAEEIGEEFELREGCGTAKQLLQLGGMSTVYDHTDPVQAEKHRVWSKAYRDRNAVKITQSQRAKRLKKRIETWQAEAKLICLGRDLPPEAWVEVLKNPVSQTELEAFVDFVYFMRLKNTAVKDIAGMLETNESEVRAALASRGVV